MFLARRLTPRTAVRRPTTEGTPEPAAGTAQATHSTEPEPTRSWATDARIPWLVALVVFVATLAQGTGQIAYDAAGYWQGAQSLLGNPMDNPALFFALRGALTMVVYLPAAALAAVLGPEYAPFAVLVQNSVLIAALAAFVLPWVLAAFAPVRTGTRLLVAGLLWLTVSGFAPYPVVDLVPVVLFLVALGALRQPRAWWLVVAGLAIGASVNIRPAYLVAAVLLTALAVAWRRRAALWVVAGIALSCIPQTVVNRVLYGTLAPFPALSDSLVSLQVGYASYVVRYDTVLDATEPRQFFCSPAMADRIETLPTTSGQLLRLFLESMPTSLWFSVEKVGAGLHWPLATPYGDSDLGLDGLFALTITVVAAVGAVALVRAVATSWAQWSATSRYTWLAVALLWTGSVVTLVGAAAEARMALPLVVIGVLGCALAATQTTPRWTARSALAWGGAALAVVVLLSVAAHTGLAHPAEPGDVSLEICRSA